MRGIVAFMSGRILEGMARSLERGGGVYRVIVQTCADGLCH
jgi:hypothetical protein